MSSGTARLSGKFITLSISPIYAMRESARLSSPAKHRGVSVIGIQLIRFRCWANSSLNAAGSVAAPFRSGRRLAIGGSLTNLRPRYSNAEWRAKGYTLIVETALRDLQHAGLDVVDQAMLAGDPSRPKTPQIALQRLRFAQSSKRMALNVFDQRVDLVAHANIGTRPVEIILPGTRCPDYSHRMSLCWRPRPAFKSRTALLSRAAFLGLESR